MLYLLSKVIENFEDKSKADLVKMNIFNHLFRFFRCSSQILRLTAMNISFYLYKNNQKARILFLKLNGGGILKEMLYREMDNKVGLE